ncbi:hypothetical protein LUZ63_017090 [Rhynchospora breviuscula]|uniref:KIB1-4 beta-propeller domain-containing protein n=1 Tax=Rhynchospora breviuscula TaxID=2022672 RepID=A0A9Q0C1T3_9POAL|nr:hypothetical protein LUZ63_017090 [Rhynchospora breviuscula]
MADQDLAPQPSSWATLPWEILSLIISHATDSAAEYVSYRRICRGWGRSLTDYSPIRPLPSPQLPFLLLPHHDRDPRQPTPHIGNVFPLPFNPSRVPRSYDLPQLKDTEGCICVGSSHGWLIALGQDSSVSILNPVTADSLLLHPLSSIDQQNLSFHHNSFPEYHLMRRNIWHSQSSIVRRAVLSSDPAEDSNFTLLLFISDGINCCYTWSGRAGPWIKHVHSKLLVEDVISIKGFFVAIDRWNQLVFFDFRNRNTGLVLTPFTIKHDLPSGDVFLVNSDGRLLIVLTSHFLYPSQRVLPRGFIKVFQFQANPIEFHSRELKCMQVMEHTDHALFLGHGCSVSVSVRHFPQLTRNAVYFTHAYCRSELVEGEEGRVLPLYQGAVYRNIISADGMSESIEVFDVENSQYAGLWNGQRPFWVTPSLNRYAQKTAPWHSLCWEILSDIILKSGTETAAKYVSYRKTCRGWRLALTNNSPLRPLHSTQLPFLLLPHHNRDSQQPTPNIGNVFPLPFNPSQVPRSYDLPQLMNTQGCICVGSSHGWLITLGRDSSVSLLNPVTADSLPLHPLSSIVDLENISWQYLSSMVRHAVLSSDPAEDDHFSVLLFISGATKCCYTWSGRGGPWIKCLHPEFLVEDVIFFNGMFVAVDTCNKLAFLKFTDQLNTGLDFRLYTEFQKPPVQHIYLVNSHDRLLVLSTVDPIWPGQSHIRGSFFSISAIHVNEKVGRISVEEAVDLGDNALFVSSGCSVSVSVRTFPLLTRNAVYFMHVFSDLIISEEGGVVKLVTLYQGAVYRNVVSAETIKVFDVENSQYAGLWNGRRPFWVTPSLNRYVL